MSSQTRLPLYRNAAVLCGLGLVLGTGATAAPTALFAEEAPAQGKSDAGAGVQQQGTGSSASAPDTSTAGSVEGGSGSAGAGSDSSSSLGDLPIIVEKPAESDGSGSAAPSEDAEQAAPATDVELAPADATQEEEPAAAAAQAGWDATRTHYYDIDENGQPQLHKGWLITEGQRWWFDANGDLAKDRLIDPTSELDKGAGWYAYATSDGYVVRGVYRTMKDGKNLVYLADNDGVLAASGWNVTSAYGQGLQRYWIDPDLHAAVVGYSKDGWAHLTTKAGYVARGFTTDDGEKRYADNNGKLQESGWLITTAFGQGLQRYWMKDGKAATDGVNQTGSSSWTYATSAGYVLRGRYAADGKVYLADNDGRLASPGWNVTSAYGQGLQRYWIDAESHAAEVGYSTDGYEHYTTSGGYVLRGYSTQDGLRYADNDGKLASGGTWLITTAFGQGLQRYWMKDGKAATDGVNQTGSSSWTYATKSGYVLRGSYAVDGKVYLADNDGRLASPGWNVTSAYGHGMQRYWIDPESHAAEVGYSTDGWAHLTTPAGYVLRGKADGGDNWLYIANNDGLLIDGAGLVTSNFEGSSKLYYLDGKGRAKTGFVSIAGSVYYGIPGQGQLLTGKYVTSNGVIIAGADGKLAENTRGEGMAVTTDYDKDIQRYFFYKAADGHLYAKTGLFTYGGAQYFGTNEGYLARNTTVYANGRYFSADNDAKLTEIAINETRDRYIAQVTWSDHTGYLQQIIDKANAVGSSTNWFCAIDNELCRVVILQRSGGTWKVAKTWNMNGGKNWRQMQAAWGRVNKVFGRNICNWADRYFGQGLNDWSTDFIEYYSSSDYGHLRYRPGKGYEDFISFHSTGFTETGWGNTGCAGILWDNAKWIYDNIPNDTTVYFGDYANGQYR